MEATADQWRRWPFLTDAAKEAYRVEAAEVMSDAIEPDIADLLREHTDRALAEVEERIAKAWDEGRRYGAADMQAYHGGGPWDGDLPGCGPDEWDCTCPNPYRAARQEQGRG